MSDSPAVIVYSQDGYPVGITQDESIYRFQVESSFKPGLSFINGRSVPANPQLIVSSKLEYLGSSNLLVDGSTPITFKYNANATKDIYLYEIRLVLVANSLDFIGTNFGSITTLSNGVKIEVMSNDILTTLSTIKTNEDFLMFNSNNSILINESGPKDVISAGYLLGGAVVLKAGSSDYLGIVIQDNLTSSSFAYFQAIGYGIKEA